MLQWTYYEAREGAGMWHTWGKILMTSLGFWWALLARDKLKEQLLTDSLMKSVNKKWTQLDQYKHSQDISDDGTVF
jgi:hypothetical protein